MPPKPPPMVNEVIPPTIDVLQRTQARIESLIGCGAPISQPDLLRILDLCKQITAAVEATGSAGRSGGSAG